MKVRKSCFGRKPQKIEKPLNDFGFALQIIQNNKDIPLILTTKKERMFLIKTLI